jgi:hypothetical protein
VIAQQPQLARDYIAKARKQLEFIKEEEDKKIYNDQIDETEALIGDKQA